MGFKSLLLGIFASFSIFFTPSQAASLNPGLITLPHPEKQFKQIYAISDVHGMYSHLTELLIETHLINKNLHWSAGPALLVIIGDSIDKGSHSIDVLDFWIRLQSEAKTAGGQVLHLLGNHEAEFLANPMNDKANELRDELKNKKIPLVNLTSTTTVRGAFLHSLPAAAIIGNWFFSHAGFVTTSEFSSLHDLNQQLAKALQSAQYNSPVLANVQSLLEAKNWWPQNSLTRNQMLEFLSANHLQGVVFGHQPKALNVEDSPAISLDHKLVKTDCGMAPEAGGDAGALILFDQPEQMSLPNWSAVSTSIKMISKKNNATPSALPLEREKL